MRKSLIIYGFCTLVLAACNATEPLPKSEVSIDSGAVIIQKELGEIGEIEEVEGIEELEHTTAEALELSYKEAVEVYDLFVAFSSTLDSEAQEALADAISAFSADIESLKYYMELADREPLLDDDHRVVVNLIANIEAAFELFAQVMEMLQ